MAIWEEFTRAFCIRFGNGENVVEELNKLAQDKSVDEYVERFEELESLMNALIPLILTIILLHFKFYKWTSRGYKANA